MGIVEILAYAASHVKKKRVGGEAEGNGHLQEAFPPWITAAMVWAHFSAAYMKNSDASLPCKKREGTYGARKVDGD